MASIGTRPTSFKARLEIALRLLDVKGMPRWKHSFSFYQILWWLNVPIRPPLFAGFAFNFMVMSIYFGTAWGAIMWLLLWSRQGMAIMTAIMLAAAAGVVYGTIMAFQLRRKARKLGLPPWEELSSEAEVFD